MIYTAQTSSTSPIGHSDPAANVAPAAPIDPSTRIDQELKRYLRQVREAADDRWLRIRTDSQHTSRSDLLREMETARLYDGALLDAELRLFGGPTDRERLEVMQDVLGLLMLRELETVNAAVSEPVAEEDLAAAWQTFTQYRRRRDFARVEMRKLEELPF